MDSCTTTTAVLPRRFTETYITAVIKELTEAYSAARQFTETGRTAAVNRELWYRGSSQRLHGAVQRLSVVWQRSRWYMSCYVLAYVVFCRFVQLLPNMKDDAWKWIKIKKLFKLANGKCVNIWVEKQPIKPHVTCEISPHVVPQVPVPVLYYHIQIDLLILEPRLIFPAWHNDLTNYLSRNWIFVGNFRWNWIIVKGLIYTFFVKTITILLQYTSFIVHIVYLYHILWEVLLQLAVNRSYLHGLHIL